MSEQPAQATQAPAHTASYVYTLADYQASRRAKRRLNPVEHALWPRRYVLLLGSYFAVLLYLIWDYGLTAGEVLSWAYLSDIVPLFAGLLAFMALVDVLFDQILVRWVFKRLAIANQPLSLAFNGEAIVWSSEGFKAEFAWSSVTRLVTLENYLFLFIRKLGALCIPSRAFASKDAFDSLITYAKERVNGQAL